MSESTDPDTLAAADPRHVVIAQRKREIAAAETAAGITSTRAVIDEIMATAERATGLSRNEIVTTAEPEPPTPAFRVDRQTAKARGVPELHLRHVFDREPIDCDALAAVRDFISGPQTLLVLSGGVGTRKSGSACWALVIRAGSYVTADDLSRLAAAKDEEGTVEYRRAKKSSLLVVDDLGGEYLDEKGWFARAFNALIDKRYAACLKTIITTNVDAATFKKNYGERVADRVREAGRFVDIGGQSVRKYRPHWSDGS